MRMPRAMLCLLFLFLFSSASYSQKRPEPRDEVEVFHWWVSGGERASMDVLRGYMERKGIRWHETSVAGSGTARYGDVLAKRVAAGQPPTAAQIIGFDIQVWARKGMLENLDDIAVAQEWDELIPNGIQSLSKYQGHWVAAPINTHSTNWLWVNKTQFDRLGGRLPDSWTDLIALLEKAKVAGIVPLAMGHEAWEHTLLFESVAVGVGGAEFYRKAFIDLEPSALKTALVLEIFQRMSLLRTYIDPGFARRSWDQATSLVRTGDALLQVQGSWVNGEFTRLGMQPGRDYLCYRFPDTQGVFLFNSDQFIFFKNGTGSVKARRALVATVMQSDLQRDLNVATGAATARVDVPKDAFNLCGKQAISDLRSANMWRTIMGSVAMGNANPPAVKVAIYKVVSDHLQGRINDIQAVKQLQQAIGSAVIRP
ncbi:MAG: ABC transporter substrate-binding protein [Burkholderiaceae bacterium]|nr:ABC transporter substrate-binding protein [Burkholderiaceae bacterium]